MGCHVGLGQFRFVPPFSFQTFGLNLPQSTWLSEAQEDNEQNYNFLLRRNEGGKAVEQATGIICQISCSLN